MAEDDSIEIESYDGVEDSPSRGAMTGGRSAAPSPGRRQRTLSPSSARGGSRQSRSMHRPSRRSFLPGLDPRRLARTASSALAISIGCLLVIAAILYYTFMSGAYPAGISTFYGALAAAIVVMVLLAFVASKLLGSAR